jgi:hypothetical protein
MFKKSAVFLFSGIEATNLLGLLDWAIANHLAQ